ncbi:carboxy-S-adenosyl-L-methionine synthase CmoA [Helicobacter sp. MIT 14-3879]|uniref:carboxy-S-adenosyl-L-methionine synthase CmoA n=1 Tax=Helicobacter sp. MIT 14-3879 TaxID=2040649 RepID=UPI000E1F6071|nr:carboxy-S-adenosyl-L-methionine synthase CmoA [Helicobacter sp. MIT 14-3879]RDU63538.1 carboxy-S-adenosyl-L-methionine synthase CmoA [Helicobacter sp. MIT 14-3879]
MRDSIFQKEIDRKFSFNKEVASVFDDMIERSIPYYKDNIKLIANLLKDSYVSICDIGCSTGNLLLYLARMQKFKNKILLGIDNSSPMLDIAKSKAKAYGLNIEFKKEDILECKFNFDVIIANYTMQFIRPLYRESLIKTIYSSLPKDGCFIMSEKLVCKNIWLDKALIDIYHSFKEKQGYSQTEISKKREALENILIPYTQDENIALLKNAGFSSVEVIFRFGNFATFIALKE